MSYISEPLTHSKNNKEVKIDLSNYVTKSDLQNATGGDTSGFPKAHLSRKTSSIFNKTILNIMTNFIPHETKIFNDREPPWMNNKVKTMIQQKKNIGFIWKIKVIC